MPLDQMSGVINPYPKIPLGINKKCCWVCRASGPSLSLCTKSDGTHTFKETPPNDHYQPLNQKETLWANKSPKVWTLENGEELAWLCFDCAH